MCTSISIRGHGATKMLSKRLLPHSKPRYFLPILFRHASLMSRLQIHVDRYKHSIYQHVSDPYMRLIVTRDPASTRFHACERFNRCDYVLVDNEQGTFENSISRRGRRVIYINPVTMGKINWKLYFEETRQRLIMCTTINSLVSRFFCV